MPEERMQGTIKWYDETKGYGFIDPDGGNKDIFFHHSAIESAGKALDKGERVEFEISETPRGKQAVHIRSIQEELPT